MGADTGSIGGGAADGTAYTVVSYTIPPEVFSALLLL